MTAQPIGDARAGAVADDPLPKPLRELSVGAWFDRRVRPLVQVVPDDCADGSWELVPRVPSEAELAAAEARGRELGTPERVTLTGVLGDGGGLLAAIAAAGVVRDAILVRVASTDALRALRHADGWYADIEFADAAVTVVAGHPWEQRPGVDVVADRHALECAAVAEITSACEPLVETVARRSRRGRAGLWALLADAIGFVPWRLSEHAPHAASRDAIDATRRLLDAPGRPWKQTPSLWIAPTAAGECVVTHRGSCCLWYLCEPPDGDPAVTGQPDEDPLHRAYLQRFGDESPRYCGTCLHRPAPDVEARQRFTHAFAARA